jgi:hypothetical protein
MNRTLLAFCLVASMAAFAQNDDDALVPYDDDEGDSHDTPKKKRRSLDFREDDEAEPAESLASLDDPNVGVGGELMSGVALLDAAKSGVDPRYYFGVRFTWEFGRLIPDEYLREMFFTDVIWTYAATKDGTSQLNVTTHLHDFTVAPAFALPLGKSFMSAYAQLGVGFDYSFTETKVDTGLVTLSGTKFLFQYGLGLRGRPAIVADGHLRIAFRIELMRFIRGYMHDMYLGAGLGMIF